MTYPGGAYRAPPPYGAARAPVAPAAAPPRRLSLFDVAFFLMGVAIMLTYSQAWVMAVAGDEANPAAAAVVRAGYFPAYGLAVVLMAASLPHMAAALVRQPMLLILMAITAASVFWSISPDQTVRRVVAIGFTTLGGVALGARFRWREMTEVMAAAFAVLVVASLIAGALVPSFGRMSEIFPGAWRGLWIEKNALGGNMAMGFIVLTAAAILSPRRRLLWTGVALAAALLVLLSTSKTSLLAMMLGGAAMVFIALVQRGPALGVVTSYGAVVASFAGLTVILLAAEVFFALLGKDATLTGRTELWKGVMHVIQERPWLGYGYGAVWDDTGAWGPAAWIAKIAKFRAWHAHNSWLDPWLNVGLVGLVAWALYYLETLIRGVAAAFRDPGAYLALPMLLVFTMMTISESLALSYNDFRWVIFVAIAVKLAYPDHVMSRTDRRQA